MAYDFYLGKMLLPVPPEKLELKINSSNKTYQMMNQGEVNVLKTPGLTDIEFEILLPNTLYPFAVYREPKIVREDTVYAQDTQGMGRKTGLRRPIRMMVETGVKYGFQPASVYLEEIERLKMKNEKFQFIVSRVLPHGRILFDTNITCTVEDYKIIEDAGDLGTDVKVKISLKQYRNYGVKKCKVKTKKTLNLEKFRNSKTVHIDMEGEYVKVVKKTKGGPVVSMKLKKTITLYNLAKQVYGDGSLYPVIVDANMPESKRTKMTLKGEKTIVKWKKSTKLKKGKWVTIPLTYYS